MSTAAATPSRTGPVARLVLGLMSWYRAWSSPRPPNCRFVPTCSAYAEQVLMDHGAVRGGWLAVRRLARCQPLGTRGYQHDPAPPPRER